MSGSRKNILFVSFDDAAAYWRLKTAFGEVLQTPCLDRICHASKVFRSAYCQWTVCNPSRASLMTAKSPYRTTVTNNSVRVFKRLPIEELWPAPLKNAGYYCSSGSKIHHFVPKGPLKSSLYSDGLKTFNHDKWRHEGIKYQSYGGYREGWAVSDPKDDVQLHDQQSADSVIAFLNKHPKDQPFYREFGLFSPHGPFITPARFKDMYDHTNFRKPVEWANGIGNEAKYIADTFPVEPRLEDEEFWQQSVRSYFSAISHADYQIGRVWDALQSSAHGRHTIVVLISDHGYLLGNRGRFKKEALWEQVANVPLIIFDPDDPEGQVIDDPVALLDVWPTLMDYMDIPINHDVDGQSLRPVIQGQANPERAVPTFHKGGVSVRKGKYRFILYADGSTEMFDLERDYWQMTPLGSDHQDYATMLHETVTCAEAHGWSPDYEHN